MFTRRDGAGTVRGLYYKEGLHLIQLTSGLTLDSLCCEGGPFLPGCIAMVTYAVKLEINTNLFFDYFFSTGSKQFYNSFICPSTLHPLTSYEICTKFEFYFKI